MGSSLVFFLVLLSTTQVPMVLMDAGTKIPTDISIQDEISPKLVTVASKPVTLDTDFSTNHVTSDDAQESTNFFDDIDSPYNSRPVDSSQDYGSLFDSFPHLPYFPDFGEIFRIQRTTTPQPPFYFPDYVRDAFPDSAPESASSGRGEPGTSRRPSRRPPRPASSGSKPKVAKQNQSEPKEKSKQVKNKPQKARDYPKIFKFTSDRVNLAEFDMRKKTDNNYMTLTKGDELDPQKVERNKFLILHGGVFEIDRSMTLGHMFEVNSETPTPTGADYGYNSKPERDKPELRGFSYYYKP